MNHQRPVVKLHMHGAHAWCLQAKIPQAVKNRLKPWQLEGLLLMFDKIIVDHEAELRLKHIRDQREAAKVPSTLMWMFSVQLSRRRHHFNSSSMLVLGRRVHSCYFLLGQ